MNTDRFGPAAPSSWILTFVRMTPRSEASPNSATSGAAGGCAPSPPGGSRAASAAERVGGGGRGGEGEPLPGRSRLAAEAQACRGEEGDSDHVAEDGPVAM